MTIWPDDKPIPLGDGQYVMPDDLEIIVVPRTEEPVSVINLQEQLDRLELCPVCGSRLHFYEDDNQTRNCSCGTFKITEVHTNGDVVFEFHLLAPETGDTQP